VLKIVVDRVAGELANVNGSSEIKYSFRFKLSDGSSISRVGRFYNNLSQVLRRRKDRDTDTPPLPTTVPSYLRYNSPSETSTTSTDSRESGTEHHIDACGNDFLWASYKTLENHLEKAAWYPREYEITHTSCSDVGVTDDQV